MVADIEVTSEEGFEFFADDAPEDVAFDPDSFDVVVASAHCVRKTQWRASWYVMNYVEL